jgi:HPt (histidine-containing phosphotransfer) domain-containing protein
MTPLPPEVLLDLQKEYLSGFPDKINEVWRALRRGDFKTICHYFHKFAGSGSTYEMPEISASAKNLEMYLVTAPNPDFVRVENDLRQFEKVVGTYQSKILGSAPKTNAS